MRSRRDVNIAMSVVIHIRLIVSVTIIPITFSDYHNRYTGLKRPIDNKLANITTFDNFSWFSLHLYHYYWKRFYYIIFPIFIQQFSFVLIIYNI